MFNTKIIEYVIDEMASLSCVVRYFKCLCLCRTMIRCTASWARTSRPRSSRSLCTSSTRRTTSARVAGFSWSGRRVRRPVSDGLVTSGSIPGAGGTNMSTSLTCLPLSHVYLSHMSTSLTCLPLSHVYLSHMSTFLTCLPFSHVYLSHMSTFLTCLPFSHVYLSHMSTFLTLKCKTEIGSWVNC